MKLSEITTMFKSQPPHGLWPRFCQVREVVEMAITTDKRGIAKDLGVFSWAGPDRGIHDFSGSICGELSGVVLDLSVTGNIVDAQPEYKIDGDGNWRYSEERVFSGKISGRFLSFDGMEGAVEIGLEGSRYEAYWLLRRRYDGTKYLRLEQIVGPNGEVSEPNRLDTDYQGWVKIPKTRLSVPPKKQSMINHGAKSK